MFCVRPSTFLNKRFVSSKTGTVIVSATWFTNGIVEKRLAYLKMREESGSGQKINCKETGYFLQVPWPICKKFKWALSLVYIVLHWQSTASSTFKRESTIFSLKVLLKMFLKHIKNVFCSSHQGCRCIYLTVQNVETFPFWWWLALISV